MHEKIHKYMGCSMSYLEWDLLRLSEEISKNGLEDITILVTGATGYLGSLCIKAFEKNGKSKVIGLARSHEKTNKMFPNSKASFIYQDITEPLPKELECDYIIHTANSTNSQYLISNPVEVIESIYRGTKNVLDYGREHKVKGIVYLSSMEVFGQVENTNRITESQLGYLDIQNVRNCYSEGKRLAELLCKSYAKEYGVHVSIARLAQTFGPGVQKSENRVFAQFARSALIGEDIVLHTRGQSMGNYCYSADVISAILLLLKSGEMGEAYTIVNEETTRTIAEMAELVAAEFSDGKSKVVFDIPEGNQYGYAPETKMRLSSQKMKGLGWNATVDLRNMYIRMLPDL